MIDEKSFNKIASVVIIGALVILSLLILRPILISSVFGLILAFMFYPLHKRICKIIRSKNFSAFFIVLLLLAIIIAPLVFLAPIMIKQFFEIYRYMQGEEFLTPINNVITSLFSSEEISKALVLSLNNSTSYLTKYLMTTITNMLLDSPAIILQLLIILFVFFFGLRDGDKLVAYIQGLSPLSKESEKKIFTQFKDITYSVIYGQILIGVIQGILTGIALFSLGIPNALVLTLLAIFLGILPLLGPFLIWVPLVIYLLTLNKVTAAIVLFIYGFFVISGIDNILRPLIVGKKTNINSGIILVSMIGGLLVFGFLGLILGPLIIAYLLLILESYRKIKDKQYEEIFIHKEEK